MYDSFDINEAIQQFRHAIRANGLAPPDHIHSDGEIHRFATSNKPGDQAGWYFIDPNGIPAGAFGDWRSGLDEKWRMDIGRELTSEEQAKYQAQIDAINQKKAQEARQNQTYAMEKAKEIWGGAKYATTSHPYLLSKGVQPHGLRQDNQNRLVVPVRHGRDIYSLQFISPDGDKQFLSGGKVYGCYFSIGQPCNASALCIAEGFATGATIYEATGYPTAIAFNCGNLPPVTKKMHQLFPDKQLIVCADDDFLTKGNSGIAKANNAALAVNGLLAKPQFGSDRSDNQIDFNDMAQVYGHEAVKQCIDNADRSIDEKHLEKSSPEIKPLPNELPEVESFEPEILPESIRGYILDTSQRQQSPLDFVAHAAICGLSAVLGRKCLIRPKQNDDWTVVPNLWGMVVGRPSTMKSPSIKEALKPLQAMEAEATKQYRLDKQEYDQKLKLFKIEEKQAEETAKKQLKSNRDDALKALKDAEFDESPPVRRRFIVNDATVPKLGELLNENPNGLLWYRDELSGWLSELQKEDNQAERAFYLECFDGNCRYTYDRIGRGTIEIENCTLSVIGGIQPSKVKPLVRQAAKGVADDGLLQRFQLVSWPDSIKQWQYQDKKPDTKAKERYKQAFAYLNGLPEPNDEQEPIIFRFTEEAQKLFIQWLEELNTQARYCNTYPMLESYLLKLPQTVASVALIYEILDGGWQAVGEQALRRALDHADYLVSHAKRLYSVATNRGVSGAHIILNRRDKLDNPFTARQVHQKGWSGLNDINAVNDAIECLIAYGHIIEQVVSSPKGGRPTSQYQWNDINDKGDINGAMA